MIRRCPASGDQCLLRCRQSRRRAWKAASTPHARRPVDRAACGHRQNWRGIMTVRKATLRNHRAPAGRESMCLIATAVPKMACAIRHGYDADTGKQFWLLHGARTSRESVRKSCLEKAAKTWKGEWWKLGGRPVGTPSSTTRRWISFTSRRQRRALNAARSAGRAVPVAIVALKRDGRVRVHYQTTPHDEWDFDSFHR